MSISKTTSADYIRARPNTVRENFTLDVKLVLIWFVYAVKSMKQQVIRLCKGLFTVSIVASIVVATTYGVTRKTSASSSVVHAISVSKKRAATTTAKATLTSDVTNTIAQYPSVQTGVSLIDLDSDTQTDLGETAVFTAASTTKVLTAATYMHEVEEGDASLATEIDGSTAQDLLQRMLNQSDNNAWYSLNDYLGKTELQSYAQTLGLTSYDPYNNVITAHDEAQLLVKLYKNELTSSSNTQLLLSFMQNTNNEDLIPAALPSGSTVYHKYGYLDGELHDAAIISYQGHMFVLVIFTKNSSGTTDDYSSRTQLFHAITEAAITYEKAL